MGFHRFISNWWSIAIVSSLVAMVALAFQLVFLGTPDLLFGWFVALVYALWTAVLTCIVMIALPWRPLEKDVVPAQLVKAGYEVTVRGCDFDLRVAKYSLARIRSRDGVLSYRSLPTSTGTWAVFLLLFLGFGVVLIVPFLLYIHAEGQRGLARILSQLGPPPRKEEKSVDDLVSESLISAQFLATQSADLHISNYQDSSILLAVMALVGFAILLALNARDMDDFLWNVGSGTALLAAIAVAGTMVLRRRAMRAAEKDRRWAEALMGARLGKVPEGGSTLGLLLGACEEVPRWLIAHRKGMWNRRPGMSFTIAIIMAQGFTLILNGINDTWTLLVGASILVAGSVILLDQYRRGLKESARMNSDWERRMSELEGILSPSRRDGSLGPA